VVCVDTVQQQRMLVCVLGADHVGGMQTASLCASSLTLFISAYTSTTTCGGNVVHTLGYVNPGAWYGVA
jgi:hypothetical protein